LTGTCNKNLFAGTCFLLYDKINLKSVAATESGIGKALTEKKKGEGV
jgi:hypothetical protein